MLSVILPTYQERENLAVLIPRIESILAKTTYEIIVVDDDSNDGTGELMAGMSARNPSIRLILRKGKLGLASAIVDGVSHSKADRIIVMDADLSHPPEKIPELSEYLDSFDLVIGSRNMPDGGVRKWPFHRKVISSGAALIARILIGVRVTDPMSGFFAIRKDVFFRTRFRVKGYKILLNILADNPDARVKEVPYLFSDRLAGKTKLGISEIARFVRDALAIRFGKKG